MQHSAPVAELAKLKGAPACGARAKKSRLKRATLGELRAWGVNLLGKLPLKVGPTLDLVACLVLKG